MVRGIDQMQSGGPRRTVQFILPALLALVWGGSYAFIKIGVASIPPITLIAGRTLMAGAILLAIMRARDISFPRNLATWRKFGLQALLNSVVPFTLIAWSEQTVEAGLATILNSTSPIFTFLMTW